MSSRLFGLRAQLAPPLRLTDSVRCDGVYRIVIWSPLEGTGKGSFSPLHVQHMGADRDIPAYAGQPKRTVCNLWPRSRLDSLQILSLATGLQSTPGPKAQAETASESETAQKEPEADRKTGHGHGTHGDCPPLS